MRPVIEIRDISKQYRLGENARMYASLRESIGNLCGNPLRVFQRDAKQSLQTESSSWALNDINLAIYKGDTVGVVGSNGAGKSTLLKIISRITAPTTGHIRIRGRVGSLLEVGTGFHPELSGRENIYLNGAILGMRKTEIDA